MLRIPSLPVLLLLFACNISAQITGSTGCPAIEIKGPEEMTLAGRSIDVSVALPPTLGFKWEVSMGNIVNGQGTPTIEIMTGRIDDVSADLIVKLQVAGLPAACSSTASAKFGVYVIHDIFPFDEYQNGSVAMERARLEALAKRTMEYEGSTAYIILEIKPGQSKTVLKKRVERMHHHLFVKRKWPKERFIFLVRHSDHPKTQLWIFPKGTAYPSCPDCTKY